MSTSPAGAPRSGHAYSAEARHAVCTMYPELRLRVWAEPDGVHLNAFLFSPTGGEHRNVVPVARATWQPSEVTETSVVDWGRRALAHWLAEQLESSAE